MLILKKKIITAFARELAMAQKKADYYYYVKGDTDMSSHILDGLRSLLAVVAGLQLSDAVYNEAVALYDFSQSGKAGHTPRARLLKWPVTL